MSAVSPHVAGRVAGREAVKVKGWLRAHRWLLARRAAQLLLLGLFLGGPLFGLWIVKGTLASSLTLGVLPLTDPLVALQSILAGHRPETAALLGAVLVLAGYGLLRGRLYCSWVCPVNIVTDTAGWLRRRLGWKDGLTLNRRTRLLLLGGGLLASLLTGTVAWEAVNPVTQIHRGLVFGTLFAGGLAWVAVAAVFLFDLAVAPRGWCGHLCPVGAFYAQAGRFGRVAVAAPRRDACDHCMDCYQVCPEPHVIAPALKGQGGGTILSPDCTACGRCVDVCPQDVFALGLKGTAGTIRQGEPS